MFGSRRGWIDPFDIFSGGFGFDGAVDRSSFAAVSQHATRAQDNAQTIFLQHLASVDTSNGPVTTEIINFHLVQDMRKRFSAFVKGYGCTATYRTISREEQNKINKTRKSLMQFASVKVTAEAQKAYLDKNPNLKKPVASGSGSSGGQLVESLSRKRDANQAQLEPSASGSGSKSKKAKKATT